MRGLTKVYDTPSGQQQVLKGIDFDVAPGEAVAIVGANGSGKSSALRCSLRLVEPNAGTIWLNGEDLTALKGRALRRARCRVGFVFQKHNLSTRLSVISNVMHGAIARGLGARAWLQSFAPSEERERAMACLEQVGLADLADRRADQLSGGQSQRVAVARALMQKPAILIADEPAASLDPKAGEDVMALFRDLQEAGKTTLIFVSHNLDHALAYADRLIGLRAGRVVLDRPVAATGKAELIPLYETSS